MSPAEDDRLVKHGEAAFALYLLHSSWFGGCIGKVSRAARPVLSLLLLVALSLCLFGGYRYIDSSSQASAPIPITPIPSLLVEMSALKHLKVAPKDAHTATVIFLHGLGDSGHGWLPVAKQLWAVPGLSHVKWILPHAPSIPITLNGGMRMPGWFDLSTLDKLADPTAEDEAGLRRAVEAVDKLVQAEVDAGTPEGRIVLGGFSQGGAVALLTAISGRRKLAGVVALSTWVPLSHKAEQVGVLRLLTSSGDRRGRLIRRCSRRMGQTRRSSGVMDVKTLWYDTSVGLSLLPRKIELC